MKSLFYSTLLILALTLIASCGAYDAQGRCKNYEPLDFCLEGTTYMCQTVEGGCRHCSCVGPDEARYLEMNK